MANITATYVSGQFLNLSAFGATSIPGTWVSETFLGNSGSIISVLPSVQVLSNNFVSGNELNLGAFGATSITGTFVSGTFLNISMYSPEVLPLTVGSGGQPTSDTRYWLS